MSRFHSGMGDIPNERFDPLQLRYKQRHGGLQPDVPQISQLEIQPTKETEDQQKQFSRILVKEFAENTIFVRDPNHVVPPVSGQPIDVSTGVPVIVAPGATIVPIVRLIIPANCIAVVKAWANRLVNPNAYPLVAFHVVYRSEALNSDVRWENAAGDVVRTYQSIRHNNGSIECPCCLPMPWLLREGVLEIQVTNNDLVVHQVEACFKGYQYTPDYRAANVDLSNEFKM